MTTSARLVLAVMTTCRTMLTIMLAKTHHQYSPRPARPLKVAYFAKKRRIASRNEMRGLRERCRDTPSPPCPSLGTVW